MKALFKILRSETRKLIGVFRVPTFLYLTVMGNLLLFVAVTAVYFLEKSAPQPQIKTYFDAFWWGVSTITTVAYGDLLPQTIPGRIIGIILMYTGTVLFISFTGVLLTTLMKEEVQEEIEPLKKEVHLEEIEQRRTEKALRELTRRIEKIEKK